MDNETTSINQPTVAVEPLPESVQRSQQAWRRLGLWLRSITPAGLARFGLTIGALIAIGWLIRVAWLALLPFVVGAVIAYILLPVVNRLDRWLPRGLAVALTMMGAIAFVIWFIALLVPALAAQVMLTYLAVPSIEDLREYAAQARAYLQSLPPSTQDIINQTVERASAAVRDNLDLFLSNLVNVLITTVLRLVNTVGFVLGFLIVPTWLLTILSQQKTGVEAVNRLLPNWMRADFWAVLRIVDRPFRAFIGGQLLLGLASGVGIYLGLTLMELAGWPLFPYKLVAAIFIGVMQLIPSLGPFLGAIPAILVMVFREPVLGATVLGLYLIVQWLVNMLVLPHIERKIIDIHPAVLVIVIVALSEVSLWWLLLAAPVTAVVRDLFRYIYGRLSDPPRPAGLLPGQLLPAPAETLTPAGQRFQRPIPLVFRRGRAVRQAERQSS
jgi:predicted PurR-regulated permease PerM